MWALDLPAAWRVTGSPTGCSRWAGWSGKRGSNPRHSAWKADALPTELFPRWNSKTGPSDPDGFRGTGAERRIRTSVTRCVADLQSAAINHSAISACLSGAPSGACQTLPGCPTRLPDGAPWGTVSGSLRGRAFLTGNSKGITAIKSSQGETSQGWVVRRASTRKSVTAAAAETFRLSMPPGIGMCSRPSQRSWILRCRPSPSAPRTSTVARSKGSSR